MKFDPATTPTKSTMVKYFEDSLKPSIKAKMDQDTTHLDNYKELIAKTIRAKAKMDLQPSFYMQKTNQQVFQRSHPV